MSAQESSLAFFFPKSIQLGFESQQAGKPVFTTRDYIRIVHPGQHDEVIREVEPSDQHRWKATWEAYKAQREQIPDGTPLEILFPNEPHIVDTLKREKIHTVEQFAAVPDGGLSAVGMGAKDWRKKAQAFVSSANSAAPLAQKDAEIAQLKEQIASLTQQVKLLGEMKDRDAKK